MKGRATAGRMPDLVSPMLAAPGELPAGPGWVVEFAWDGLRCIAYARPGRVRLLTVNERSVTSTFPELAVLGDKSPPRGMVLDGTVVALDDAGTPDRRLLVRRTATPRPSPALVAQVPVGFFVSDLLWLDGVSVLEAPYRRRRELIDALGLAEDPIVLSPSWPAREAEHVMQTAARYRLDGLYAKRLDALYQPGRRSPHWLRVPLRRTRQVVVGGWTPADPRRPHSVAALLLGVPGPDGLRYVGRVGLGSGPHRQTITDLVPDLLADSSPFAGRLPPAVEHDAVWALPRLVGRVEFREWTADGRLRLPAWRGLVAPEEVDDGLWDDAGTQDGPAEAGGMAEAVPAGDPAEAAPGPTAPGPTAPGPTTPGPTTAGLASVGPAAPGRAPRGASVAVPDTTRADSAAVDSAAVDSAAVDSAVADRTPADSAASDRDSTGLAVSGPAAPVTSPATDDVDTPPVPDGRSHAAEQAPPSWP
ncbi:hypothetical protein HF519_29535, partial [Pseudonocardia bannensis]